MTENMPLTPPVKCTTGNILTICPECARLELLLKLAQDRRDWAEYVRLCAALDAHKR